MLRSRWSNCTSSTWRTHGSPGVGMSADAARTSACATSARLVLAAALLASLASAKTFTIQQALSAPFPSQLTAAPGGRKVAWILNQRGVRNIWTASAPDWKGARLTPYASDDGVEIGQLQWTPDGGSIVYVRGGDLEFLDRSSPNPRSNPEGTGQAIWIAAPGSAPREIAEGNSPAISPKGDNVAYLKGGQVWSAPLAGSGKAAQLIHERGSADGLRWSPDGSKLAFVSDRGNHSFIGVYDVAAKALAYLDPSVDRDFNPVWSQDGKQLAFVRIPAGHAGPFVPRRSAAEPWSIRVATVSEGSEVLSR